MAGATAAASATQQATASAWGANNRGELGDGTTTNRRSPVPVAGLSDVTAVAAGGLHSMAVKSDGTAWAWGYNDYGQLGDGTTTERDTPVQVTGLSDVTAVATNAYHSVATKSDGTVWAWGYNSYGQLGDGTTTERHTPVQVTGLTDITAAAAGNTHSLAVESDGTVWAWGYNGYGQLGDGTNINRSTAVQVTGLTDVVAVAAGELHSLAVKSDGTAWAWGYNGYGQLGDGTTTERHTPVQVTGLTDVTAVAAGAVHSVAIKTDGTAWAWGENSYGQLGDGTTTERHTPVQVTGLTDITAAAAGNTHSLAVESDGAAWAWGYNGYGQLGDGTNVNRSTPVQVTGLSDVTAVAAGWYHSLAVKTDSTAPVSSATVSGSSGSGGWFTSDVGVTITATDGPGGSGVASITYSATGAQTIPETTVPAAVALATISTEGVTTVTFHATDGAANTETPSKTVVVRIDKTAPTVVCDPAPSGWSAADVAIACSASDAASGLAAPADAAFSLSTAVPEGTEDPAAVTGTRTVCDVAGLCATAGPLGPVAVDKKAPTVTITTPPEGATYTQGQTVTADYTCADSGSGIAACNGPVAAGAAIDTSTPGAHAFTVTATDKAGNATTLTAHYTVTAATVRDSVSLAYTGGLTYTNSGTLDTGNLEIRRDGTGIVSVTGAGTIAGTHGGSATVSFSVNRLWILPLYSGTITVSDPGAAFNETTVVLLARVSAAGPNSASGRSSWINTAKWPWKAYKLTWTVTDAA